jgi:hypothetical protein
MTETPPPPPAPLQERVGLVGELVKIVQSITLTQVLTIALLVIIAIPAYVFWRAMNDASMLNKFLSRYEEVTSDKMSCTLRIVSLRGGDDTFMITTGFAYQGSDRYIVGVIKDDRPDESGQVSYCEVLNLIVDYMRRPDAKSPTFPGTDEPLIWHYPPEGSP